MGRPRDPFVAKHADYKGANTYECNYCKRTIKGSVTRVRNHLSGLGTDISECESVPDEVREEAIQKTRKKRQREEITTPVVVASDSMSTPASQAAPSLTNKVAKPFQQVSPSSHLNIDDIHSFLEDGFCDNATTTPVHLMGVSFANPSGEMTRNTTSVDADFSLGGPSSTLFNYPNVPSSSNIMGQNLFQRAAEESVMGAVLKFFMCTNSEFIDDPNFDKFLETVRQCSVVPSRLLLNDRFTVSRSMTNIEQEVSNYMWMVQESWTTTGCTLMVFNLKVGEYVYGFYSSRGFIFVKADARMCHSPSLYIDRVTHYMHHGGQDRFFLNHFCELSYHERSDPIEEIPREMDLMARSSCVRHKIKGQCIAICDESEWARSLITKAGEIHKLIAECYLSDWYRKALERTPDFKECAGGELENPLSRFISIILLEHDLKERLPYSLGSGVLQPETELKALLNESKFWDEGRELIRALTPVLRIPHLMDTLVPMAGYLDMVIDKAKHAIFNYDRRPMQQDIFWESLKTFLNDDSLNAMRQPVAAYLNPAYFWSGNVRKDLRLKEIVNKRLQGFVKSEERETIDEELQRYNDESSNPFVKIVPKDRDHPVVLWEEYGKHLPLLRKCAIQILSQPVSCLSNQVKKHMLHLEGRGDYILRLNVRMMEEFKNLGNTYRPIDLQAL